jgi:aldehyde dehydrogenase (NAD+)
VVGSSGEIGDAFISHPIPRIISFTGSTLVGRRVAELAAKSPIAKRVMLELGGNTPTVVLGDANLDQAVLASGVGRFLHQEQIWLSSNRIIVDESVLDEFEERFIAHVKTLKYGNPNDADTVIGPIISSKQFERLMGLIESARGAGARELLGGEPQGLVVPPHVFADVTNDMEVARNELFGPVAPIIKVKGEEEALRVAYDTEYGVSSSVISGDMAALLSGKYRGTLVTTDVTPTATPAIVPINGADIVRLLSLYLTASADVSPG